MRTTILAMCLLAGAMLLTSCSTSNWSTQLVISPGGKASFEGNRKELAVRNLGPGTVDVSETSADGEVLSEIPLTSGGSCELTVPENARLEFVNNSSEKADLRITGLRN